MIDAVNNTTTVYEDEFITIRWNNSRMFNVYFNIDSRLVEVDCFETGEVVAIDEAKRVAREYADDANKILG